MDGMLKAVAAALKDYTDLLKKSKETDRELKALKEKASKIESDMDQFKTFCVQEFYELNPKIWKEKNPNIRTRMMGTCFGPEAVLKYYRETGRPFLLTREEMREFYGLDDPPEAEVPHRVVMVLSASYNPDDHCVKVSWETKGDQIDQTIMKRIARAMRIAFSAENDVISINGNEHVR